MILFEDSDVNTIATVGNVMLITYEWTNADGRDLDTRTSFKDTLMLVNDRFVGWGTSDNVEDILLWTSGDNLEFGIETVIVNLDKLRLLDVTTGTLRLGAFWYGERRAGSVTLKVRTPLQSYEHAFDVNLVTQDAGTSGQGLIFVDFNLLAHTFNIRLIDPNSTQDETGDIILDEISAPVLADV